MFIEILKRLEYGLHLLIIILFVTGLMASSTYGQPLTKPQEGATSSKRSLTLDQVIQLALFANRTIRGSEYGIKSQKYGLIAAESEFEWKLAPTTTATTAKDANRLGTGLTLAKKSRFGPTISLTPEVIYNDRIENSNAVDGQVDINLTIPLLRGWGKEANLNAIESARYSSRSIQRSHHLTKVNVVLDTVRAVYAIIEQKELLRLNQLQTQSFKNHVVMAAAKEKIGLATPMDVYRAQIRLKDVQDRLNRSQEALQNVQDHLKLIIAVSLDQALPVTAHMTYQPLDITVEKALETAFLHRVELEQVVDEINDLERSSRVARHLTNPQLDLVGRYNHLGLDDPFQNDLESAENYWSISLVSTTDWRRTSEKANYQRSLLAVEAAKLNRWALNDAIRREVRQTYDALLKSEERVQIRKEQIQQANGKLALARVKFIHDMADNFDVIEAQTELQSAQANMLAAKIEHIVGRYQLRAAMGTLLEDRLNDTYDSP
jgi:outer membrane protein